MIPAIKKKTAVLFIDDDKDFLDDICDFLPPTNYFYKFNNASEVISKLNRPLIFVPNMEQDTTIVDFPFRDLRTLFNEASNFPFSQLVSVVVVDHRMDPVNGIDFCRAVNPRYVKRIMLTSFATQEVAIKAFNEGIIDMFLLKTDKNLVENLADAIKRCTEEFFMEISKSISGYKSKLNPFNDPNLTEIFNEFCQKHEIIEFCLIHDFNQIVMKDKAEKKRLLNIYTDEDLEDLLSTEQAASASHTIQQAIRTRTMAPCFVNEKSPLIPCGTTWDNMMVPLLPGGTGVFIAHT